MSKWPHLMGKSSTYHLQMVIFIHFPWLCYIPRREMLFFMTFPEVCWARHSTKMGGCRSRSRRARHLVSARSGPRQPRLLCRTEELALSWKPQGWSDGGRSDSKDFLAWAKRAIWRNEKCHEHELFPLFRLGRASCGVSLVAGSSDARDVARQMQAEGLLVRDSVGWRRLQRWPNLSGNASFNQDQPACMLAPR